MASSTANKIGAEGRTDLYFKYPEDLYLITDKASVLWDERLEFPIDEGLVADIMLNGVEEAVHVRRNGSEKDGTYRLEVVDGRQRTRHACEANRRRKKAGMEPLKVKIVIENGSDQELFEKMVRLNQYRKGDTPSMLARKSHRHMQLFKSTIEQTAKVFAVEARTLERYQELLHLHPDVQAHVDAKRLPVSTALELASLQREEQSAAAQQLIDSGAARGLAAQIALEDMRPNLSVGPTEEAQAMLDGGGDEGAGKPASAKSGEKAEGKQTIKPSNAELRWIVAAIEEDKSPKQYEVGVRDLILYILGDASDITDYFKEEIKAFKADVKKRLREKAKKTADKAAKAAEKADGGSPEESGPAQPKKKGKGKKAADESVADAAE